MKNPPSCFFASFLIVSLIPFINKPDSSGGLIVFIISFFSSSQFIYVVVPDPEIFFWITAFVADAAAVNLNETKTRLANGMRIFFINGKRAIINGLKTLRNPLSWMEIFLAVSFNKIYLFSKNLITFIISFTLFFLRVIPAPKNVSGSDIIFLKTSINLLVYWQFHTLFQLYSSD